MEIRESIIHGVLKAKETNGEGAVVIRRRPIVLPLDDRLHALCADVLSLYTKLSNGYGTFGQGVAHPFPEIMQSYSDGNTDVISFSNISCDLIANRMKDQFMATTSWPLFVRYTNQGRDWLLVAMLKLKEGVGIDEETLDLNNSLSFDISHLHEAARIDIEKWRNDQQPYLSFIKRRAGESEITQYFRAAISCTEYTDAKHNTEVTIKAMEEYCAAQGWGSERCQLTRDRLYNFCNERKHEDAPVNLTALSAHINEQDPESFVQYIRENNYEVSEVFSPNPASYKKLMRVSRRFGTISVSFDVDDLRTEAVYYDADADFIIIKSPPVELVRDMKKALGELIDAEEQA
jgi:nucleoid-associated protein